MIKWKELISDAATISYHALFCSQIMSILAKQWQCSQFVCYKWIVSSQVVVGVSDRAVVSMAKKEKQDLLGMGNFQSGNDRL